MLETVAKESKREISERMAAAARARWEGTSARQRSMEMKKVAAAIEPRYSQRCTYYDDGVHKFRPRGPRRADGKPDLARGGYYICSCKFIKPKR